MPLSGKLVADFSSFSAAVSKAQVELRGFEGSASRVQSSLSRMADSLSGRRVMSEATLMAEAIERIGGVSRLTATELQRVGAQAQEAVAKMRAMGEDVPEKLQRIADATKTVNTAQTAWVGTLKSLAGTLGIAFSGQQILQFGKQILDTASDLDDLSNQTQMSVEDLQLLGSTMSEFGVDAASMGQAIYNLSRQIAGGDESIVVALDAMGLKLRDVQGLGGFDLFMQIEKSLGKLQGSLRDEVSSELFGARIGKAMAGASTDIEAAIEVARKFNSVISTDQNAALDDAGERFERWMRNFKTETASAFGQLIINVEKLKGGLDEGTIGKWQLFRAVVGDTWKVLADKQPAAVKDLIAALTQETEANTGATDANAEAQKRNAASLAQRMEAAKLAAAEQKKINDLVNQLTGDAAVEKAKQNLAALQQLRHDGAVPLRSEYEGLVKIFGDATKALETQGLKGTQTYRDLKAELDKYKEALKYDELPRGSTLLPSRRIDTMLGAEAMPGFVENMGASVKVFEESQAAAKAWADEVEAGMKAIDAEIQKYYELQGAVIDQAVEGANKAASAYDRWRQSVQNLTIAEQQSAWLSKKPEGMSVTEYATTLGPAFGGKRTSGAPAVNVVVHAENSFLDTPADQMRLAQRMGDAAIQTTRG